MSLTYRLANGARREVLAPDEVVDRLKRDTRTEVDAFVDEATAVLSAGKPCNLDGDFLVRMRPSSYAMDAITRTMMLAGWRLLSNDTMSGYLLQRASDTDIVAFKHAELIREPI